jgi:hypothetical protein
MTGFLQPNLCLVIMPLSVCLSMSSDTMLEFMGAADYLILCETGFQHMVTQCDPVLDVF